jgi:nitrate reductase (cytochrome), electron transfer subunit
MQRKEPKIGKITLGFAVVCILGLPLVLFSASSYEQGETQTPLVEAPPNNFDQNGKLIFEAFDQLTHAYLEGTSEERTLSEYYSRRQYPGSPPYIPHKVENENARLECLACHEKGGWTEELKRNTPVTPHPEQASCRQCHARPLTEDLFVENLWLSIPPPVLGRSYLPGAPPPIPHDLMRRENCIACHVGPGAVNTIRVEHASRGNCRQCHVPDLYNISFERPSTGQ